MTDVAVDLGKTNCRARVVGAPTREGRALGAPGLAAADGTPRAVAAVADSLSSLHADRTADWGTIAVGAAGALAAPEAAASCAERLLHETGAARVVITSDAVTAHLGAFAGGPGVTVIAGTGAVAIGVDPSGELAVGDGAGPEAGDRGSGAWIGRTALGLAAAGAQPLAERALARYGARWRDVAAPGRDYELAHRRGDFVGDVVALAEAGDDTAADVIQRAAAELARTTRETIARLVWADEHVPVSLVGGVTGIGRPLLAPFTQGVRPAVVRPARGDALDGAAHLIDRLDLPHERHVTRRERP